MTSTAEPAQPGLFDDTADPCVPQTAAGRSVGTLLAAPGDSALSDLAAQLQARFGGRLRVGTSSWHFPGWAGLVWGRPYAEAALSRHGLATYARHPLLDAVSLDRAFYRPLDEAAYTSLAAQVQPTFRFVVKAASMVTDAVVRTPDGKAMQPNVLFLDPAAALELCVQPALHGLQVRLGVIVFQLSPLPLQWLHDSGAALIERLEALWRVVVPAGAPLALELRDASLLTPALAASLKAHGVRYCVGLNDRMPSMTEQLPLLRATWPGDLVVRWNLQRGFKYAAAKDRFAPFDRLRAPDVATREALAKVIVGTLAAGYGALVTINNKAEGSAPLSVLELAREVLRQAS